MNDLAFRNYVDTEFEYDIHPVLAPKWLRLETPAMRSLLEELHHGLWTGSTGWFIKGEARVGKSCAVHGLL